MPKLHSTVHCGYIGLHSNVETFLSLEFKEVFKLFDKDGDGVVTSKELGVVMSGQGLNMTDEDLHAMITSADTKGKQF